MQHYNQTNIIAFMYFSLWHLFGRSAAFVFVTH